MPSFLLFIGSQNQQQQKHDIFVGNLAFHTTEDQLHQAFSEIGRVLKVRLVTDAETGKPRGFAFVEFEDPQAALSAIRNMNEYELNGRRLRVNFSNSSHLEALAGKLGMDLSNRPSTTSGTTTSGSQSTSTNNQQQQQTSAGTQAVADALKGMSKGEMYDVIAQLKEISDKDPDEARRIISGHPQLPEAILFLMSKLDMVKDNPAGTSAAMTAGIVPQPAAATPAVAAAAAAPPRIDPRARADPRAAATSTTPTAATAAAAPVAPPPPRADPRAAAAARVDPRAARADPRASAATTTTAPPSVVPPPPMMQQPPPPPQAPPQQYMMQPGAGGGVPPPPPPQQAPGVINIDPALVQQVMSLTPQQIAQLPPDKQQSILALRQQISGGR